mmetsp:Transcript_783/g.3311  ORF Transcript_783/g.3311 Transcript_783/m.3311 type:complete len:248 (+) Transcript_783:210-953(+)
MHVPFSGAAPNRAPCIRDPGCAPRSTFASHGMTAGRAISIDGAFEPWNPSPSPARVPRGSAPIFRPPDPRLLQRSPLQRKGRVLNFGASRAGDRWIHGSEVWGSRWTCGDVPSSRAPRALDPNPRRIATRGSAREPSLPPRGGIFSESPNGPEKHTRRIIRLSRRRRAHLSLVLRRPDRSTELPPPVARSPRAPPPPNPAPRRTRSSACPSSSSTIAPTRSRRLSASNSATSSASFSTPWSRSRRWG